MESTARRWWGRALALGVVATLGLAACGGGGGEDDGVATLGGDGASSGEDDGGDDSGGELTDDEIQDAQLDFAECMREHGIDMPDPQVGEDGRTEVIIGGPDGGGGAAPDPEKMEAAQEACAHFMEKLRDNAPEMDPEEQEQAEQQALDFAECMREQGVEDFPDPEFMEGGGIGQKIEEGVANDPDMEAAEEHCAEEIGGPFGERRLNGGGPAGGSTSGGSEGAS
jgi:hypothetical protein